MGFKGFMGFKRFVGFIRFVGFTKVVSPLRSHKERFALLKPIQYAADVGECTAWPGHAKLDKRWEEG